MKRQLTQGVAKIKNSFTSIGSKLSKTASVIDKATSKKKIFFRTYSNSKGPEIIVAYLEEDLPKTISAVQELKGYAQGVMIFINRGDDRTIPKTGRVEEFEKIVKALKRESVSLDRILKVERPYNDIALRSNADFLRPLVLRYHQLVERFPDTLDRRNVARRPETKKVA